MGLPIPQGFTVTTEACTEYNEGGKVLSEEMTAQIEEALKKLESIAGKTLGDNENPLLVSVRSGARASMPGMMDTVLNPVSYTHLSRSLAAQPSRIRTRSPALSLPRASSLFVLSWSERIPVEAYALRGAP